MQNKINLSEKIYINKSEVPSAGRGVFAKNQIKKSDLIERCPFLEIRQNDPAFKSGLIIEYLFFFGKNKEKAALVLGFGSLYNHSETPNAKFKIKPGKKIVEFSAIKDIEKGEEITLNYRGGAKGKKNPMWFEKNSA